MKKLFVVASLLIASLSVSAQDYKPVAGETTLELQFAPLSGSPFSMGGIRFRQFIADQTAIRGTVFVGYTSSSEITQQADNALNLKELKDKESAFTFALRPGIEKHFGSLERLSPYYGAELDFAIRNTKEVSEFQAFGTQNVEEVVTKNADGYTRLGLNAIFGADYYIAEKVFLGAELGFGFSYTKNATEKVEAPGVPTVETKKAGDVNIGPNVLGTFRLGIVF